MELYFDVHIVATNIVQSNMVVQSYVSCRLLSDSTAPSDLDFLLRTCWPMAYRRRLCDLGALIISVCSHFIIKIKFPHLRTYFLVFLRKIFANAIQQMESTISQIVLTCLDVVLIPLWDRTLEH
jgi:hypothetical protein